MSYRTSRIGTSRYTPEGGGMFFGLIIIGFIVLMLIFGIANATHTSTHIECLVTDKDRTGDRNGGSDMRVYTKNCGVFEVADSWLSLTWSSADTYNSIHRGSWYNFTTRGWRIPFFSSFPNIVGVEEVAHGQHVRRMIP